MASLPFLLAAVATIVFVYSILLFLRRPAKPLPPGPRGWPIVGSLYDIREAVHSKTAMLSKKYGPIMHLKIGLMDVVVATSASVAEEIFRKHDANFMNRPENMAARYFAYGREDIFFSQGARWRMLRKICQVHLFSNKAMDALGHIRQEEMALMIHVIAKLGPGPEPVNLSQLLNVCQANTLGRMLIGRRMLGDGSGGADEKSAEYKSQLTDIMVDTNAFNIGDYVPIAQLLERKVIAKLKGLHVWFDAFLTSILDEHRAAADRPDVLLTTLLSFKDTTDEKGSGKVTETLIKGLLLDLLLGGTDPTSAIVQWTMSELILNPNILARVRNEVDSVVGPNRLVTEDDLPRLTYLQAVLKEVFRLHPTTPVSLQREAIESCEIKGYHIPKGTVLLVNMWAIARDPERWPDPLVFRPERFLPGGEGAHKDVKGNDYDLLPFLSGRRMCVAINLALRLVHLLTAALVHAFDWELPDGQPHDKLNMDEKYGITLQRAQPLMAHPKPRLAPHVYGTNA